MKWRFLLSIGIFIGIANFCHVQTEGFWLQKILRKMPDAPRYAAPPLSNEEEAQVRTILSQPFHYLGMGSQCFCFVSEDEKYVIKFFKLDHVRYWYLKKAVTKQNWAQYAHLFPDSWLRALPLPSSLHHLRDQLIGFRNFRVDSTLMSCKISFDDLKEETGTLYLHFNHTDHLKQSLTLIDKLGIAHTIDLDTTRFLLQKKGELVYPHLTKMMQKGKEEQAKQAIQSLLRLIVSRSQKGIANTDALVVQNFGFINGQAVEIDTGSFIKDERQKQPHIYKRDLLYVSLPLRNWLEKHYPTLVSEYDQELLTLLSS